MKRLIVFLFALALASPAALAQQSAQADRLNILFFFADDWGRIAGCYKNIDGRPSVSDVVKTPNVDRLAREGVMFRNAFVTAPSCTPCRSSLLSGQYFFRTGRGAILSGAVWDLKIPSYPLLLRDAGYHIGETYKVWSPGTPNDAPYGSGQYKFEAAGGRMNQFSQNATKLVKAGKSFEEAKGEILGEVDANFKAFLDARKGNAPWAYWFGPTNVHRKYEKGSGEALWKISQETLKGKLPAFMPDVPEIREDMADYLGEIQAWDAAVGVLLKRLEETGQLDKTLIMISGDHGPPGFPGGKCNLYSYGTNVSLVARMPGGKGGRVVDDFVNLMDLAPTFCEIGGVKPPEVMTGRSILNVLKSDQSGQIDPSRSWVITGRERHVAVAREGNLPYPQRALRTKDFLYIRNFEPDRWPMGSPNELTDTKEPAWEAMANETYVAFADMDASPTKAFLIEHRNSPEYKPFFEYAFAKRPGEQLFDLKKDPYEMKNVADDPAYAHVKKKMGDELMAKLKEYADPRVTGDGKTFEKPPYTVVEDGVKKKQDRATGKGGKKAKKGGGE